MSTVELTVQERLQELLEPLKEMLALVRTKREKTETELDRLKSEEKEILRAVRSIDPTFEPRNWGKKKSGSPQTSTNGQVGEGRVTAVREWLEANSDYLATTYPKGYTASDLKRDEIFAASQPGQYGTDSVLAALRVLHDRGAMRLDHRGTGGSKYYALIGGGS